MTAEEMLGIVRNQLAIDLNCAAEDLSGPKDHIVFVEAADNPGRRPFRRGRQFFEMLTMGQSIVVSATPARLAYAREQLRGLSRDEALAMPFIRGHAMHFLPDLGRVGPLPAPEGFDYERVTGDGLEALRALKGFDCATQRDREHPVQAEYAWVARRDGAAVAMATAFVWAPRMRSIGVDVLPEYRGRGLAAYLANEATQDALGRDIVPVYATSCSNLASQRVAHRVGYAVAWVSDQRLRFEGGLSNA
ncbi:MAG: GNAT family N-acetyltransferase [Clostridiales bacterium]|nr:GNAT family N-acetyltransferase [Clostridiales bacterium]